MNKLTTLTTVAILMAGFAISNPAAAQDQGTAAPTPWPESREIDLTGILLLVPVAKGKKKKGDPQGKLSIRVAGNLIHNLDINLAQKKEDVAWWAHLDTMTRIPSSSIAGATRNSSGMNPASTG